MLHPEPDSRRAVADRIRHRCAPLAERVYVRLLPSPPQPGDPLLADLVGHIEALASAIEIGSPTAFAEHTRWSQRILESRSRSSIRLDLALEHLAEELESLVPESADVARPLLEESIRSCFTRDDLDDSGQAASTRTWRSRNIFLKAILEGNRRTALAVCFDAAASRLSLQQIYEEIIMDSLYEIGRRWERNEISIADEHLATVVAQGAIHELFPKIPLPPENGQGVVVATVEGERHSVGVQMVADILTEAGWRVRLLGCDIPLEDFLHAVRKHQPEVVCLSATLLPSLAKIGRYIAALNQEFRGATPSVLLGGQAIRMAPDFARECGADEIALDLNQCRLAVARLMRRNPMRHSASNRLQ